VFSWRVSVAAPASGVAVADASDATVGDVTPILLGTLGRAMSSALTGRLIGVV
jgi:hypothetical protein